MRLRSQLGLWVLVTASCTVQAADEASRTEEPNRDRNRIECKHVKLPGSHIKRTVCLKHWQWQEEKRRGMAIVDMLDNAYKFREIPTGSQF